MPPETAYSDGARHYCTTCGAEYRPGDMPAGRRLQAARAFLREHRHEVAA